MTRDELNKRYFNWMCRLVCDNRYSRRTSYKQLLQYLHEEPFSYIIDLDGNRAADGTDLRYRFGYENGYNNPMVATYLDDRPCSILEMMIALAIRCEEHIMEDPEIGNRTGQWFWNMIVSLGLGHMTDDYFDLAYVEEAVRRFLNREYSRDGSGGLFTIERCPQDMRRIEIWYQMCMYLQTIL